MSKPHRRDARAPEPTAGGARTPGRELTDRIVPIKDVAAILSCTKATVYKHYGPQLSKLGSRTGMLSSRLQRVLESLPAPGETPAGKRHVERARAARAKADPNGARKAARIRDAAR